MNAVVGLALIALVAQPLLLFWAASAETHQSLSPTAGIPVYAAADDGGPVVGSLANGEKATPIAETQSAGGAKWYLIRTKSGVIGWIKHADNAHSKAVESFFRSLPHAPPGIGADVRSSAASAAQRGAVTIPVTVNGRSVIVPVTFNHSVNAHLLLDTGASMTMISRRLATVLALPASGTRLFSGIGGTVSAPIARVESIKVGDAEVSGMAISVHDISRYPHFEGLLGMDFLGRFQVSVDATKKLLVLTPK